MAVTINTIAKKAGVSAPVVSAVINNNYKNCRVGEEKRRKIEKLIKQLNYVPSGTARSLVKKETRIINIIIPSVQFFMHYVNNNFIMGVQEVVEQQGYRLKFTSLLQDYKAYQAMDNLIADGLLVFMWGDRQFKVVKALQKFNYPILVAYAKCNLPGVYNIFKDNYPGMHQLARHCIEQGHKNILYVEAFGGDYYQEQGRKAIETTVKQGKVDHYERLVLDIHFDIRQHDQHMFNRGREAIDQMTSLPWKPDLLMFSHDLVAFGGLQRLQELGISVPDQLSVTGNGDHPLAHSLKPFLTTTQDKSMDMGKQAAELLIDVIQNNGKTLHRETVTMEAVIRDSVKKRD